MIKSAEQKVADDTEQTVCGVRITGITTGKIVDYGVPGFHEYGSRYGSGGSGLYSGASARFFQKSILV